MVDAARNFGGTVPEYYESIMGPAQFEAYAADMVRRLPPQPPGDVLEVACGTGIVTRRLRERLDPAVRLVASDISEAMLNYARGKVRGTIEWRSADAEALPFRDAEFGAAVCAFGIMFVPDKNAAFGEMRRVLREGGTLLFSVWDGLENNPHGRASSELLASLFPGDPIVRFGTLPFQFNDEKLIARMLAQAGFGGMRAERVRIPSSCPSAREFAAGQLRGTPRGQLLEQQGVRLEEVIDKLGAAMARVGGDAPFRYTPQALVVEARAV
jgi:ubiquinone/menaquinone biosynthesis C-methylase UbiE